MLAKLIPLLPKIKLTGQLLKWRKLVKTAQILSWLDSEPATLTHTTGCMFNYIFTIAFLATCKPEGKTTHQV